MFAPTAFISAALTAESPTTAAFGLITSAHKVSYTLATESSASSAVLADCASMSAMSVKSELMFSMRSVSVPPNVSVTCAGTAAKSPTYSLLRVSLMLLESQYDSSNGPFDTISDGFIA